MDSGIVAALIGAKGHLELRKVPRPELEPGSIMVRMRASGICGTDLEKLSGAYTASTIIGHEVAGIVSESKSELCQIGDMVIPHHHVACGSCFYCERGAVTMCDGFHKSNFYPGGFAEEFKVAKYNVDRHGVHKFSNISFESASSVEPLGCCIRGLEKATKQDLFSLDNGYSKEGNSGIGNALIVGAGPIGLLHMELLRATFPEIKLVAIDISRTRLDFAGKFEGAFPIDAKDSQENRFSASARKETEGYGYDLVIVATANKIAFAEAVACVRKSGTLLLFGAMHKGSIHELDLQSALLNELSITTSYATSELEMEKALHLLQRKQIDTEKFVTGKFPLARISEAMEAASSEGQVKSVVTP